MLLLAVSFATQSFDFSMSPEKGLHVSLKGVPVVRGSGFQFYSPGWSKGYFSSAYHSATITHSDSDTVEASWVSEDGLSVAKETLHRDEGKLKIHYAFDWSGDSPAKVELTGGMLWAPALESGSLMVEGAATRSLLPTQYGSQSLTARRYGTQGTHFGLQVPFGSIKVTTSTPFMIFDGRNGYRQDWAEKGDLLWLGCEDLTVEKGTTTSVDVEWDFSSTPESTFDTKPVSKLTEGNDPVAYQVPEVHPSLIPLPRKVALDWDHPLELTGSWAFPAGRFGFFGEFEAALERRFEMPKGGTPVSIDGGVSKLGLTPGAFRVTIRPTGISVVGEKDEGFRYGLQRIASLAFVRGGKLYLPTGTISDEPLSTFRGVHLFVGPRALEFQKKLVERVLMPLGFNKVVLQCERAAWKSTPGIETSETMSLEDLAKLFKTYRDFDLEPIPLIESFGHDGWLFANGKNLDVAMDPKDPYALDPRKPRTKDLLDHLWDEAIDLLHPETIHFGLDEVDLRGFPADSTLKTALWKAQLGTLSAIAKRHDVKMMLWGDQLLGPQEAPDAAFGDTSGDAADRRSAVPSGALIADWHYLADPNPSRFAPSLRLFSNNGLTPIASTWYRPENIRGFDLAAIAGGFGTLQTTWAGYTSSEDAMIANLNQFTALVLSADYGWSGRQDDLKDLDYDPAEVFRKLYFGRPQAIAAAEGKTFSVGKTRSLRIGSVDFQVGDPIQFLSNSVSGPDKAPLQADLPLAVAGKHIAFAMSALLPSDDGEKVGEIEIVLANGKRILQPLVYGHQVRAGSDSKACLFADRLTGISSVLVDLGATAVEIKSVQLRQIDRYSGLQIAGITAY